MISKKSMLKPTKMKKLVLRDSIDSCDNRDKN